MKSKYYTIYDRLYDIFPEQYLIVRLSSTNIGLGHRIADELRQQYIKEEQFIQAVKHEILNFEFEYNFPLRPDAKYFLLTSFSTMIIKPLVALMLDNDNDITDESLTKIIKNDIEVILVNSISRKKEDKVSGHEIMSSIDSLWGQLQSTKLDLWG